MKATRFFQVMILTAAAALCMNVNAQPRATHAEQPQAQKVEKHHDGKTVDVKDQHKGEVKKASKQSKQSGLRTTSAVKLRNHAANNSHSVKDKRGNNVVIPKGAKVTYVDSKGNYYKVTYKGYTGYIAKKYTTGRR